MALKPPSSSQRQRVKFQNQNGNELAGLLELPASTPLGYVLFAHCFTCGKDISSASRIARALAAKGYAVLRFDFTGLGSSDGDFANTNFSSNVEDLVAAASFLREELAAPDILIGHSLGGAAVLAAAEQIPESKSVVTIGAPATPAHVIHNFEGHLDKIEKQGLAEVNLGGRPFTIKQQFVEDLKEQSQEERVKNLKRSLLIFHSPTDATVSIDEAAKIYSWAKHPKSFVSLHGADHLLTKQVDAEYVADTIVAWVKRYLSGAEATSEEVKVDGGNVLVGEKNQRFTRSVYTDDHHWFADEPTRVGGDNRGPDPYEMLLAGLGACTSMTMRMYANRKDLPVDDIYVSLSHKREHSEDCQECNNQQLDVIERTIRIEGDKLNPEQRARLLEIADKCPVHRTLENKIEVRTTEDTE